MSKIDVRDQVRINHGSYRGYHAVVVCRVFPEAPSPRYLVKITTSGSTAGGYHEYDARHLDRLSHRA